MPLLGLLLMAVVVAAAVQNPTPCSQRLTPCGEYLNSTKPPESCCGVMRKVVEEELPCICTIITTPSLLQYFGLNQTQALRLVRECGSPVNLAHCQALSPDASDHHPPPAVPGGKIDRNGATRTGLISTLIIISLVWASVLYILI